MITQHRVVSCHCFRHIPLLLKNRDKRRETDANRLNIARDRHTDIRRHVDTDADRQIDTDGHRQTDRQTDRQTHTHTH